MALSLLEEDKKGTKNGDDNTHHPAIKAVLLIYPTIRSPTCWCIVGGLHAIPSFLGKTMEDANEHKFCYGSNKSAMERLLPTLPENVLCLTVNGDMLLPAHKHSGILIKAMKKNNDDIGKREGIVEHLAVGERAEGGCMYVWIDGWMDRKERKESHIKQ